MNSYGKIIRNLRLSKSSYNIQELAELLGITAEQLRDIEASYLIPSDEIIAKMAHLLKVNEGYLSLIVYDNLPTSKIPNSIPKRMISFL